MLQVRKPSLELHGITFRFRPTRCTTRSHGSRSRYPATCSTLGTHERPKTMPDATGNPVKPAWLPVWFHRSCYSRPGSIADARKVVESWNTAARAVLAHICASKWSTVQNYKSREKKNIAQRAKEQKSNSTSNCKRWEEAKFGLKTFRSHAVSK